MELLSDPNSLLRSIFASSGDCIKILDLDGRLVFMTEGGQRIMEVSDFSRISGCPWPDFWQGQGNVDAKNAIEAAKAGRVAQFQSFARTMAGTPKWWDVHVSPILGPDGKPEKLLVVSRDITASQMAAQARDSSERQLRMALSAGRIGHWSIDFATGIMTASDICKENFGRDRMADFNYDELRDAIHPDDKARVMAAIERTIATDEDYDIEYRVIKPDGSTGWVLIKGQLVRDDLGKPFGMSGVSLDVGALRGTEKALAESEARFKTFAQAMPNQIWSSTPDGMLDWFNDQVYVYSGLAFGDLEGTGWAKMVHPDDIEAAAAAWANALAAATQYQTQFRLLRADGSWRWHLARALPIKDHAGVVTRWIGTNTDIEDQKAAEAELHESEQRAAAAIDAADIGTWDFNPTTGVLKWDKRCYELFGLAVGKPVSFDVFLAGVHPNDRAATEKACLDAMLPDGTQGYDIEYRTIGLDDGVERWVSAKGKADFANGAAVRFIGTILDITKLKRAEAQQALLTRELEHRMKNNLAMVAAIANQTFRTAATKEEARTIFDARLRALSHAHELLTKTSWTSASMPHVVEGALAPHRTGEGRIRIAGPEVELTARQALSLALALHELATNAAKYGALSNQDGTIDVVWDWVVSDEDPSLRFEWRETGGPRVALPTRRGFGSRLIERTLSGDFGGAVAIEFNPTGVVCRFEAKFSESAQDAVATV